MLETKLQEKQQDIQALNREFRTQAEEIGINVDVYTKGIGPRTFKVDYTEAYNELSEIENNNIEIFPKKKEEILKLYKKFITSVKNANVHFDDHELYDNNYSSEDDFNNDISKLEKYGNSLLNENDYLQFGFGLIANDDPDSTTDLEDYDNIISKSLKGILNYADSNSVERIKKSYHNLLPIMDEYVNLFFSGNGRYDFNDEFSLVGKTYNENDEHILKKNKNRLEYIIQLGSNDNDDSVQTVSIKKKYDDNKEFGKIKLYAGIDINNKPSLIAYEEDMNLFLQHDSSVTQFKKEVSEYLIELGKKSGFDNLLILPQEIDSEDSRNAAYNYYGEYVDSDSFLFKPSEDLIKLPDVDYELDYIENKSNYINKAFKYEHKGLAAANISDSVFQKDLTE